MPDDRLDFWTRRESDAAFSEPGACERRATRFERTIRRRNLVEYVAGAAVIALFVSGSIATAVEGWWDLAAAGLLVVAGTLLVLWKLAAAGSNLDRRPELSCREHLRAQFVRQRDLLRTVPAWYLAPLVPGILGVYGAVVRRVAETAGLWTALEGVWIPLAATAAFFLFIGWLNLATAKGLDRRIAELDREV